MRSVIRTNICSDVLPLLKKQKYINVLWIKQLLFFQ